MFDRGLWDAGEARALHMEIWKKCDIRNTLLKIKSMSNRSDILLTRSATLKGIVLFSIAQGPAINNNLFR